MQRREAISGLGVLLGGALIPADTTAKESFQSPDPLNNSTGIFKSIRNTITLSDNWRFQVDIKNIGEEEKWFKSDFPKNNWTKLTSVPQAWDCYQSALWEYEGIGWYATTINPGDFTIGRKVAIIFNRVMYHSKVWLNGEYLGENIGGYLPFNFDITSRLKPGEENTLVLRVDNKPRIEWLPAGKQIEWIQYGGILGRVEIVSQRPVYIDDVTIQTTLDNGPAQINCHVSIANETDTRSELELEIQLVRGNVRVSKNVKVVCKPDESTKVNVQVAVANAELWSPDSPALYRAEVSLKKSGVTTDNLVETFGIRQVTVDGKTILLNGMPIRIKGVNRYDDYNRYGPNVPEKLLREELALMKSVGINFIRMHYPQSPDLLSLYDEYGFMMMEEIPMCWWGVDWFGETTQSLDILHFAKPALAQMIARDKNHPAIIFWSMANECQTQSDIGITVMRDLLVQAKSLDPTRLVTFVVAGSPEGHLGFDRADIICINKYNGVFGDKSCNHIADIDSLAYEPLVKELKDHRSKTSKPIVIAEFGTQGIKNIHGDISYSEEFQAAFMERIWEGINSVPGVTGGVLWCWADYFHRKYFITYAAFGPYGVVTTDRKTKKSLEALTRMYDGSYH